MRTSASTLALVALSCRADLDPVEADLPDTGPLLLAATAGPTPQHASDLLALVAADLRQFDAAGPGRFTASPRFGLTAELTSQGLRASARADSVALATVAYGGVEVGGAEPELGGCALGDERVAASCVRQVALDHGNLTEWWVSRADGLEHGWTLHAPPEDGPVSITVALSQGVVLQVDDDGAGVSLLGSTGGLWRYDGLVAWDNDGVGLPARLVDEGTQLRVEVDVIGARWPVTIDPALSTETKLVASDGAGGDYFGVTVTGAGDLNGDGYDDLVVGAPWDDDDGTDSGSAYVYYGSATGIDSASEYKLTASDGATADYFGLGVAGAGDIDGDGYGDVVVGASGDDDNGDSSGSAYVYYGSATGVDSASEDKLIASDGVRSNYLGYSTAGAGDIDGDGYDDLVVSAHADRNGSASGKAYVWYGSATGIDSASEDKISASDAIGGDDFGVSVAGAGDVNGDGYDDLVMGAKGDEDNGSGSGSAYVYYGSAAGIDHASEDKLVASDGAADDVYGSSVSGAGDVNGDGYDDLVVGAYLDDDKGPSSGSAYVYYGSATGIDSASEDKLIPSDGVAEDHFGLDVAGAGDIDGDGYGDVVVGARYDDDNRSASGSTYVWYGSATGIDRASEVKITPSDGAIHQYFGYAVSGAGDLDGDGYADLVVGAYADDDNGPSSGAAYVYGGGCRDADGDGYGCDADCDERDDNTNPGAAEVCDDIDNDCDGAVDNDAVDAATWYTDADGDGYGDPNASSTACAQPDGAAADATDCDDTDAASYPGATDVEDDGIDQDCDGGDALADVEETDDEGNSGCGGCASTAGPASTGALWLLIGLLGVRRRRRHDGPIRS